MCVLLPRLFDEQPSMLGSWDLGQLSSIVNFKSYHCIDYTKSEAPMNISGFCTSSIWFSRHPQQHSKSIRWNRQLTQTRWERRLYSDKQIGRQFHLLKDCVRAEMQPVLCMLGVGGKRKQTSSLSLALSRFQCSRRHRQDHWRHPKQLSIRKVHTIYIDKLIAASSNTKPPL
jgi:hypothetical protein